MFNVSIFVNILMVHLFVRHQASNVDDALQWLVWKGMY